MRPTVHLRRAILFRITAIGLSLLPLAAAEIVLRLSHWSPPVSQEDPYLGFTAIRPLFELDSIRQRYEIPLSRQRFFRPESFSAEKGEREFRIFCLGDSTVQGNPWGIETSFTSWLEDCLHAADPDRTWEVVNCGGISYASYRLVPILEEVLQYQPDLIIIYTGHNEFLEERTYSQIKQISPALLRVHDRLARSRVYTWLRAQWLQRSADGEASKSLLPDDVDAMLDYRNGLDDYHRDDDWREGVVEHYEYNLERLCTIAQQSGVPLLLSNPVCNLRDSPPFKYEHRSGLSPAERQTFAQLWQDAQALPPEQLDEKIALLDAAVAIDDRHAAVHFHLAKCWEARAEWPRARVHFERACNEDICPLRILTSMREAIQRVGARMHVPIIDIHGVFAERSPGELPGEELLVDHVHPSIFGQQLVAETYFDHLVNRGWVVPREHWQQDQRQRYQHRLALLPLTYYARGEEHLEGLRKWSQGRAPKMRPSKSRTNRPSPATPE